MIVSTPQPLALADVRRAVAMFRLVKTPIFGIVENMSGFQCPKCGETSEIFAVDGAAKAAKEFGKNNCVCFEIKKKKLVITD